MTTFNKATLKTFFENGDIPTGQNFADLIDSNVNLVETARQNMAGDLYTPEINAAMVSADRGYFNTQLTVEGGFIYLDNSNIQFAGGSTSILQDFISTNDTSFGALKLSNTAIVSAAGTAQATAANVSASITRLTGVVDGSTTGFRITAPKTGRVQYIVNVTNVSANLWPSVGCSINGNAVNQVFPLAGNTAYTIFHTHVSGYGVK